MCDVIYNEAVPFRPYCADVATRTRNVSEYMLVLALCLPSSGCPQRFSFGGMSLLQKTLVKQKSVSVSHMSKNNTADFCSSCRKSSVCVTVGFLAISVHVHVADARHFGEILCVIIEFSYNGCYLSLIIDVARMISVPIVLKDSLG